MAGGTGVAVGWRAWRVVLTGAGARLRSAVYDDDWQYGAALAARCPEAHRAPQAACTCGIHAARDACEAARYLVGRDDSGVVHRVLGLVALTGRLVEHTRGWRGECGAPLRIWVPAADTDGSPAPVADVMRGLAGYAVPVEVVPAWPPRAVAAAVEEAARKRHGRVSHACAFRGYARA